MSNGGKRPSSRPPMSLQQQLQQHNIVFEPPASQTQNQSKTGDKNSGRKPSANHFQHQQEDQTMNTGTTVGRDVAGEHHQQHPLPTMEERRAFLAYSESMQKAVEELRNPLSMKNLANVAATAAVTVALGYAVSGIVGLFKPKDVMPKVGT